ncbi:winged helix-turn-helix domain-containing protein [Streptomyces sp. NPDC048416]|uniref:winged helix-turn-helix domain-containing protein n=1 Tax=Streptomyces sp. NPDC048416 TaxID=3365546 RepID=UPI0037132338
MRTASRSARRGQAGPFRRRAKADAAPAPRRGVRDARGARTGRGPQLLARRIQGVRKPLVRNGWSCQIPARRAMERDEETVAGWAKEVWPCAEG